MPQNTTGRGGTSFGTIPRRSCQSLIEGQNIRILWSRQRIGSHNLCICDGTCDLFAEEILECQLLLLQVCPGDDQIPLGGGHLGLGRHDVQWRQRPDLSLSLVVLVKSLCSLQCLFRRSDLFLSRDEVPVALLCLRQHGVHLLQVPLFDELDIVSRNCLKAAIKCEPKTTSELLDRSHGHPGNDVRIVD